MSLSLSHRPPSSSVFTRPLSCVSAPSLTWYHRQPRTPAHPTKGRPSGFHAKKQRKLAFFKDQTCVVFLDQPAFSPQAAAFSDLITSGPLQGASCSFSPLLSLLLSGWIWRLCFFSALDRLVRLRFQQRPLSSFIPPLIAYTRWAFTSSSSLASLTVACCFFWTAVVSTHTR